MNGIIDVEKVKPTKSIITSIKTQNKLLIFTFISTLTDLKKHKKRSKRKNLVRIKHFQMHS